MEPGDIDGGTPPTEITSKDSQLARPGPVPLDDDSWDVENAWLSSAASVDEAGRYQGQRRSKGTGSTYRWWIGGAAAVIASVAVAALVLTPLSGGTGSTSSPPGSEAADGPSGAESGRWWYERRIMRASCRPASAARPAQSARIIARRAADHAPFPQGSRAGRLGTSIIAPDRACGWATGATPPTTNRPVAHDATPPGSRIQPPAVPPPWRCGCAPARGG